MNIYHAPLNQTLAITQGVAKNLQDISDLESRLMHLGFIEGQIIQVKRRPPFFHEPLLVEVRGRLVAMNKMEAELVQVEVMK